MDKQDAETSVGKLLGSLIDDGFESEPFEEYGKRWTSHTTAYDDDFGHMRFQVTRVRTDPNLGESRGRGVLLMVEGFFLRGREQVS